MFISSLLLLSGFAQVHLDDYIRDQAYVSEKRVLAAVGRPDGLPGSVIAAPSKADPDYYYHWVRDAALVVRTIHDLKLGGDQVARKTVLDFISATQVHQARSGFAALGEPKYYVNGDPYTLPWGRPQNDGPALRAITLMRFANELLDAGDTATVRSLLYDSSLPTKSVIKLDLEYTATKWYDPSYDLWEEIKGDHFYTLATQHKALIEGAKLATRLGDTGAAQFYQEQASEIEKTLWSFVSTKKGRIIPTLNRREGHKKTSDLDIAVILAVLHTDGAFMSYSDPWVMATLYELEAAFKTVYKVNSNGLPGVAIGRYPEDVYYNGNPWFLTTAAHAEILYKMAKGLRSKQTLVVNAVSQKFIRSVWKESRTPTAQEFASQLVVKADEIMERIKYHAPGDLRLSEQFDRNSGFCLAAPDLTWSYAAFLTAAQARQEAVGPAQTPIAEN